MVKKLKQFPHANIFSILKLTWYAHPRALAATVVLNILQGLLPLATAWITKLLFDLLAQQLEGETVFVWSSLLWLVSIQTILMLARQIATPLISYSKAELNRILSITIQTSIYSKINSFAGIAPFENPELHDTIRLASQGAQHGSEQTL
ncbi:MAG: hypothetical protein GY943_22130, partial [Chloroflexi bacterium]|nr:hypothetical protein [Chloroflexota bacterium]